MVNNRRTKKEQSRFIIDDRITVDCDNFFEELVEFPECILVRLKYEGTDSYLNVKAFSYSG
jgi:hypothetical protein